MPRFRPFAVLLHRWAGLVLACFLVVEGLTGSLIAFDAPLDRAFWPVLAPVVPPVRGAEPLSPGALDQRVRARLPAAVVDAVMPPAPPADASPAAGASRAPVRYHLASPADAVGRGPDSGYHGRDGRTEVCVDPYTGRELGRRQWGDIREGAKNLMPFVHRLHNSLALGSAGSLLLGIVALIWTVDCFVGAGLTLPKGRPLLAKWRPAWSVQGKRLNLDLHRAGGLWLWALLFVFAWSGVGFQLEPVHGPVMRSLTALVTGTPARDAAGHDPVGAWMAGLHTARIGGPAVRVLVSALGLAVAGLAATGVVVWSRKRRGRVAAARAAAGRRGAAVPATAGVVAPRPGRPVPMPAATRMVRREHRASPALTPALATRRRPNNQEPVDSLPPWPPTPQTPRTRTFQRPSAS